MPRLRALQLGDNDLTGPIPPELARPPMLAGLFLQHNRRAGELPPKLVSMPNLTDLHINGDSLTGPIPAEIIENTTLKRLPYYDNAGLCMPDNDTFREWTERPSISARWCR